MVDYKKNTGSSGTMMIRDNGTVVEFFLNSNNSSTFNNELPWGYTINGSTNNTREVKYSAGAGWVRLGYWSVTTDQTVTFRIGDTGTSGFGGPTTLSANIDRATVPAAPSKPVLSNITATTMRVTWNVGGNGGAAIDNYQVARNTSNTTSSAGIYTVDRDTTFGGLSPGTLYYWWARTHNAKGWGPWSAVAYASTIKVGDAPDQVIVSDATQTSVVVSFTDNGNGGSAILERQIAYSGYNTTSGAATVTYTGVRTIDNLIPGYRYYFWARVRNAAGWGPYSAVVSYETIAGAYFNISGTWKKSIPYVKVGGVWKIARPWIRESGNWKQST